MSDALMCFKFSAERLATDSWQHRPYEAHAGNQQVTTYRARMVVLPFILELLHSVSPTSHLFSLHLSRFKFRA